MIELLLATLASRFGTEGDLPGAGFGENPRLSHLEIILEAFGNHLGGIWEAFGGLEAEEASGRHLEQKCVKTIMFYSI